MNDATKHALVDICKNHDELLILDAFNLIFRYHFSHKDLSVTTDDGRMFLTGHLFGFTRNLLFLKEHFPNSAIVIAIDGVDSSRREVVPEYKADRQHEIEPMDDMAVLMGFCSLVEGVYTCYDENYEADDVVCSVSRTVKHLCDKFGIDKHIYIVSTDKDMYQLVTDEGPCTVSTVKKWGSGDTWFTEAQIINEDGVRETFNGVSPKNLVKFRAITGDSSDNLKGYYRFYKKNAAVIAENFSYDRQAKSLTLRDGVDMRESWNKFLPKVLNDMDTFVRNYEVMLMKEFDFELESISRNLTDERIGQIMGGLEILKLYYYMTHVAEFSPYSTQIKAYLNSSSGMDEDLGEVESVQQDLGDLL